MANQALFNKSFTIKGGDFAGAGEASVQVKNILKDIGFDPAIIRRVAVASYEAEINVVMYGGGGVMQVEVNPDSIFLVVEDAGPGIPDVKKAMVEGFSTATEEMREMGFGAGMGLPNIRKNSDSFQIDSIVGKGTTIAIKIHT